MLKKRLISLWENLINSGITDDEKVLLLTKVSLINIFSVIAFVTLIFFGIINLNIGNAVTGYIEIILGLLLILNVVLLRLTKNIDWASSSVLLIVLIVLSSLIYTGGIGGTGIFWIYAFPIGAFFLKGKKMGWVWMFFFLSVVVVIICLSYLHLISIFYPLVTIRQVLISLIVVSLLIYFYENVNEKSQKIIIERGRELKHEKEVDKLKTDFISLVSHQLRTPLSATKWTIDLMREKKKLGKTELSQIEDLYTSNERMIALVNALLNITRLESGRIIVESKRTNIKKLVADIVNDLKVKTQQNNLEILIDIDEALWANVDPRLVTQIFSNLITNAVKYTKNGGTVKIDSQMRKGDLFSQVWDNGTGIPEKEKEKVFKKFFRGENIMKKDTQGSGLGLYLTKMMVEALHGKIDFKSDEKNGTVFWFSLPQRVSAKGEVKLID